jgi:glycolate oxidase FAD binding subunit
MAISRSVENLADSAARIVGAEGVRVATPDDAFDVVRPLLVVSPGDANAAGAVLDWASRDNVPLVIRGAGTKLTWGPLARPADVIVSTLRLNAVVDHRHGDLTATVQAGAALAQVNRELGLHRQWIPLDPSREDGTIGGILATNDSGPRRHRYGAPRDLIIGITVARTDGRLARSGGIVVKNVAGYDMARLMTGSFGTLALIVDATFKLAPAPPASRTVIVSTPDAALLNQVLTAVSASQTMPTAVELELPPGRLLVRLETVDRSAEQQSREIAELAAKHGAKADIVSSGEDSALWQAHAARPWDKPGCVVKISTLRSQLPSLVGWIRDAAGRTDCELVGRAGVAVLLLRLDGEEAEQERLVTQLRARFKPGEGHVTLLRASPSLKTRVDASGSVGDALQLMQIIKRQFDPAGILNPGRGPGGL